MNFETDYLIEPASQFATHNVDMPIDGLRLLVDAEAKAELARCDKKRRSVKSSASRTLTVGPADVARVNTVTMNMKGAGFLLSGQNKYFYCSPQWRC